ncbi:hypothetical protein RYX36_010688 [Vicia faba]
MELGFTTKLFLTFHLSRIEALLPPRTAPLQLLHSFSDENSAMPYRTSQYSASTLRLTDSLLISDSTSLHIFRTTVFGFTFSVCFRSSPSSTQLFAAFSHHHGLPSQFSFRSVSPQLSRNFV